jgi:hypothetical protein
MGSSLIRLRKSEYVSKNGYLAYLFGSMDLVSLPGGKLFGVQKVYEVPHSGSWPYHIRLMVQSPP